MTVLLLASGRFSWSNSALGSEAVTVGSDEISVHEVFEGLLNLIMRLISEFVVE